MAEITFKGNPVRTVGHLPNLGSMAPGFTLTKTDLSELSLGDLAGRKVVLNIFPSVDTGVCAMSVRRFNAEIAQSGQGVVVCISRDLPFAHSRFCGAEGLKEVVSVSAMRSLAFGEDYGVRMVDGPLSGLFARAVVVIDAAGQVIYTEQVPEITQEPDYAKAMAALG